MASQSSTFPYGLMVGASVVALAGGCAAVPAEGEVHAARRGVAVGESGYRSVKVTGSHIPVLVPTSPTARPLPSAVPVRTMSPEEFDRIVRLGQR